jgi:hypothetical protein
MDGTTQLGQAVALLLDPARYWNQPYAISKSSPLRRVKKAEIDRDLPIRALIHHTISSGFWIRLPKKSCCHLPSRAASPMSPVVDLLYTQHCRSSSSSSKSTPPAVLVLQACRLLQERRRSSSSSTSTRRSSSSKCPPPVVDLLHVQRRRCHRSSTSSACSTVALPPPPPRVRRRSSSSSKSAVGRPPPSARRRSLTARRASAPPMWCSRVTRRLKTRSTQLKRR